MNKLISYLSGLILAGAIWVGVGQSVVHHYVFKHADKTAYERFEKDPVGWSASKVQIDAHYREADELACMLSMLGALASGFFGGVFGCRLYDWNRSKSQKLPVSK